MDRKRKADLDPSLAEDANRRQERLNQNYLDLLKDAGAIAVRGSERMGDIMAEGLQKIPEAYRAQKKFKMDKEAHDIRVENARAQQARDKAEDEYWNGLMPEDYSVSVEPAPVKPHTVIGGVDFGYQKPLPQSNKPDFNMTDPGFLPRNQGQVSSPGAARVLDGAPMRSNATMGAAPAYDMSRQNQPIPGQAAAQNVGPYQMRKMTGGIDFGKAEDAGPASDFNMAAPPWENQRKKPLTRRQHMLELQMQKDEQELELLRQGKGKGNQAVEWMYTKDFTPDGRPILFNRLTGETKAAEGVQGVPRAQGESQSLIDLRKAQAAAAQARADAIKTGKPTGGASNEWQPTGSVDEEGRPISFNKRTGEYKVLGEGVKVKPKGSEKPATAAQTSAAGFADRAMAAHQGYQDLSKGYDPASVGSAARGIVNDIPVVGAVFPDQDYRKAKQFQNDFISAVLRKESGAAISNSEYENERRKYFPEPGDSPEVVLQKAQARQRKIDGLRTEAGNATVTHRQDAGKIKKPEEMTDDELRKELGK